MPSELLKLVSDSGPVVVVVLLFLGFLLKSLKVLENMMDRLVQSINVNSGRISAVEKKIDSVVNTSKEIRKANEEMYKHMRSNIKHMREHGLEPLIS